MERKERVEELSISCEIRRGPVTDHYDLVSDIGRSRFAVVRKMKHKSTGRLHAVKFMKKRRLGRHIRDDILREIGILTIAQDHPNIVNLVEVYETTSEFAVVMEYVAGGELHFLLEENLKENEVAHLMKQILTGLQFLHDKSIVHRDIKPQNILLTRSHPDCIVKLCDFGLSRLVSPKADVREIAGTTDYLAPEVLNYERITAQTDMWSLGVLAYVLLSSGHSPFAGDEKQETYMNISQVNLDFPDSLFRNVSAHAVDFITRLLVSKPGDRLTIDQCFQHPWLRRSFSRSANMTRPLKSQHKYKRNRSDSDFSSACSDCSSNEGEVSLPKDLIAAMATSTPKCPSDIVCDDCRQRSLRNSRDDLTASGANSRPGDVIEADPGNKIATSTPVASSAQSSQRLVSSHSQIKRALDLSDIRIDELSTSENNTTTRRHSVDDNLVTLSKNTETVEKTIQIQFGNYIASELVSVQELKESVRSTVYYKCQPCMISIVDSQMVSTLIEPKLTSECQDPTKEVNGNGSGLCSVSSACRMAASKVVSTNLERSSSLIDDKDFCSVL